MKQNRKANRAVRLLAVIMLLGLCLSGCGQEASTLTPNQGSSHFIYVGLADADTGQQELTMDQAMAQIRQTLTESKQGATVLPTWGGFVGEDGAYHENETVLVIVNAEESVTEALAQEWKTSLNAACVYVERYDIQFGISGGQM